MSFLQIQELKNQTGVVQYEQLLQMVEPDVVQQLKGYIIL